MFATFPGPGPHRAQTWISHLSEEAMRRSREAELILLFRSEKNPVWRNDP